MFYWLIVVDIDTHTICFVKPENDEFYHLRL